MPTLTSKIGGFKFTFSYFDIFLLTSVNNCLSLARDELETVLDLDHETIKDMVRW